MRYAIIVTVEARKELAALKSNDLECYSAIVELLRQFHESQELLADLMDVHTDSGGDPTFEVKLFEHGQRKGYNLYILKFYTLEDGPLASHRVIYSSSPLEGKYHVLGIVDRDLDYDRNPAWIQAIFARYDNAGVPRLPKR